MTRSFSKFAVADWSGAKGQRHPGIALAMCETGSAAPVLIDPPSRHWSRREILEWLLRQEGELLIGFDFSFAPPFHARGSYFPEEAVPETGKALWQYVEEICEDEDLGASSFLEQHLRDHFYFGAADGRKSDYAHLRACEARYNAGGGGKPSTIYDVIGAAQVAKASFAGMRLLHHANRSTPVWPFDPVPTSGPVIVEIYTQIAARCAGIRKGRSKIRTAGDLDKALEALGTEPHCPLARYTDHATDAILAAAWLRKSAMEETLWKPAALTPQIATKEGWTFGVS